MNILFVCTGNTCRSPMAEALLKNILPKIEVKSAGIFAMEHSPANLNAVTALKEKEITLDHHARNVSKELLEWADLVLTMTKAHKFLLMDRFPEYKEKFYTLINYVDNSSKDVDIVDPYGGDLTVYRNTLTELEKYIELLASKIID